MRALIISSDQFEDSELLVPLKELSAAGIAVDVAAPVAGAIHGKRGHAVDASLPVSQADAGKYDLVLLPGGKAPAALSTQPAALDLVRRAAADGSTIAAICHGPQILAAAGLLRGRRVTGYPGISHELSQAGAQYVDAEVVVDRNLITSRRPADLPAFISAILSALGRQAQRHRA